MTDLWPWLVYYLLLAVVLFVGVFMVVVSTMLARVLVAL